MVKDKNASSDRDKIPITSAEQVKQELATLRAALAVKETEHSWEGIDRAFKRFTAVTRGGACKYEDIYLAGLKDRELAKAINGCLATERTQLSASVLLFLSAATRLGHLFLPLLPLYLPTVLRLLSRTNKLYVSRSTACVSAIIRNTRLANVIPYLREGMDEKAASHRRGCITALLCLLGGEEPAFNDILVDKDLVTRKYAEDVEKMIKIGATDKDIEVRKIAKTCWQIYRSEFANRIETFAAPLTPIIRKYLELPPPGVGIPPPPALNLQARPAAQAPRTVRTAAPAAASKIDAATASAQICTESRPASRSALSQPGKAAPTLSKSSGPSLSAKLEAMRQPLYPLSLSTSSSSTHPINPLPISRSVSSSAVPPTRETSEDAKPKQRHLLTRSVTAGSMSHDAHHTRQASAAGPSLFPSISPITDSFSSTSAAPTRHPFQTNFSPAVATFTGSASAAAILSAQASPQKAETVHHVVEQAQLAQQALGNSAAAYYQQQARRAPPARPPLSHQPTSRAGRVLAPTQTAKAQQHTSNIESGQAIQSHPTAGSSTAFVPSKRPASALSSSSIASTSSAANWKAEGVTSRPPSSNASRPTSASSQHEAPVSIEQVSNDSERPGSRGAQAPTVARDPPLPQKSQRNAFRPARPQAAPSIPSSSSSEPSAPKRIPSSNILKSSVPASTATTQARTLPPAAQSTQSAGPSVPASFKNEVARARSVIKSGESSTVSKPAAAAPPGPPTKRQAVSSSTSTRPTAVPASAKPPAVPVFKRPVHPSSGGSIFSRLTAPTASSTARARAVSKENNAKRKEKETLQKPVAKSASQKSLALKSSVNRKAPEAQIKEASRRQEGQHDEPPANCQEQNVPAKESGIGAHSKHPRSTSPNHDAQAGQTREITLEEASAQPLPPSRPPSGDSPSAHLESLARSQNARGRNEETNHIDQQPLTERPLELSDEGESQPIAAGTEQVAQEAAGVTAIESFEEPLLNNDQEQNHEEAASAQDNTALEEVQASDLLSGEALLSLPVMVETSPIQDDEVLLESSQPAARSTTPIEQPPSYTEAEPLQTPAEDEDESEADATLLLADSVDATVSEPASEPFLAAVETSVPAAQSPSHALDQSAALWSAFSQTNTEGDVALMLEEQPSQRAWFDDSVADQTAQDRAPVILGNVLDDEQTTVFPPAIQTENELEDTAEDGVEGPELGDLPDSEEVEERQVIEEEEEDDVALLISRELSDDSLEELASRFEQSMIGPLHIDDDDDRDEPTPMRIQPTQFLPESWLNGGDENEGADDEDATQMLTLSIKAPRTLENRKDKLVKSAGGLETPTRIRSPLQEADVNTL